jgi:hypothetical protein
MFYDALSSCNPPAGKKRGEREFSQSLLKLNERLLGLEVKHANIPGFVLLACYSSLFLLSHQKSP